MSIMKRTGPVPTFYLRDIDTYMYAFWSCNSRDGIYIKWIYGSLDEMTSVAYMSYNQVTYETIMV